MFTGHGFKNGNGRPFRWDFFMAARALAMSRLRALQRIVGTDSTCIPPLK